MRDLVGTTPPFNIAEVIQLLSIGKKTGLLTVTSKSDLCKVYLQDGMIIYATNSRNKERIGAKLVAAKKLSQVELDKAIEYQKANNLAVRLGHLLRDMRLITDWDLQQVVREQIQDAIYNLFEWNQCSFGFDHMVTPGATEDIQASINPMSLMMEATRRVDEWEKLKTIIPSMDVVVKMLAKIDVMYTTNSNMSKNDLIVVHYLDGKLPLREVAKLTGLTDFDVATSVATLIERKMATIVGEIKEQPAQWKLR